MKIEVKKLDSGKHEIAIEVSGDVIKNKFEEVFQKIAKDAKAPGFRPGHVPRDILEKNYSSHAHEQALRELIPYLYNEAIEKEGLDVIELPDISDVQLDRVNLSFKAVVSVRPEIILPNYKGIKVQYKKNTVSSDEIKRSLDAIKESKKLDAVDDGVARSLGYPNVEELESAVEKQLFTQKENSQRQKLEDEVIEAVTKGVDFSIPQSMIERQLDELVKSAKIDLALKGMPREKIEEQEKPLRQELMPQAKKQVKVYLILAEIAKKESLPQDEHLPRHCMEFLLKEADWQEVS